MDTPEHSENNCCMSQSTLKEKWLLSTPSLFTLISYFFLKIIYLPWRLICYAGRVDDDCKT